MIFLIGGTKGGTGKTTLVTNLAVEDILAGNDSILIEADNQGSSTAFTTVRDENQELKRLPCVIKTGGTTLIRELAALDEKYDNVFVDAGGYDNANLRTAMIIADKLIVPLSPSSYDVWALARLVEIIKESLNTKADIAQTGGFTPELQIVFVLNKVSSNPKEPEEEEVRTILLDLIQDLSTRNIQNVYVATTSITSRKAFLKTPQYGMSVSELPPPYNNPKAIEELQTLYREIIHE